MKRPIRKKAFFRAWKRKELHAIAPYDSYMSVAKTGQYAAVFADRSCPSGSVYILWPGAIEGTATVKFNLD